MCLSSSQLPPPLLFLHSALLWPPRCRLTFDYEGDGNSDVTVPSKRDTDDNDDDDKVQQQQEQCQQLLWSPSADVEAAAAIKRQ